MPAARPRDERLCWLSVKHPLARRVHRRRMWETLLTLGLAPEATREWERQRMSRYAVAVDRMSARLDEADRAALRETGRTPDWFLPAVLAESRRRPGRR